MLYEFTVNGKPLSDFGVYWDGSKIYDKPKKDITFYEVPGRNGDLYSNGKRFGNLNISVNCYIKSDFANNYEALMNYLYSLDGYVELTNTKEPNVYRMGQFVEPNVPTTGQFIRDGKFTLVFNCIPQKYNVTETSYPVEWFSQVDTSYTYLYMATDDRVKDVLNNVPEGFRSNAEAFYMFNFGDFNNQTVSNVTLNWSSNENIPMYVFWDWGSSPVYYYTNGNVQGASFYVPSHETEGVPAAGSILTPMQLDGIMTFSGTANGTNFSKTSPDFSQETISVSQANAIGADIKLSFQIYDYEYGCLDDGSIIMLSGYRDDEEKGRLYIVCQTDNLSASVKSKVKEYVQTEDIPLSGYDKRWVDITVDLNNFDIYAHKTGMPDLSLNNCFNMVGDIGPNINKLKIFAYPKWMHLQNRDLYENTADVRWWKL